MVLRRTMVIGVLLTAGWAFAEQVGHRPAKETRSEQDKAMRAKLDRIMPPEMLPPITDFQESPKHLIFNFRNSDLADVIDFMGDDTETDFFVNWKALESIGIRKNTPVTVKLYDPTLKEALSKTLELISTPKRKVQYFIEEGMIVITAAPDPKNLAAKMMVALPEKNDRSIPEVNFDGTRVSDVFDFLSDISGLKFKLDVIALEKSGIKRDTPVTLRVRKEMKVSSCIRFVLEDISGGKVPLQCVSKDGVVTVTTAPQPEKAEK